MPFRVDRMPDVMTNSRHFALADTRKSNPDGFPADSRLEGRMLDEERLARILAELETPYGAKCSGLIVGDA